MTDPRPASPPPAGQPASKPAGARDDRLDPDLERQRGQPGANGEGSGSAGADPGDTPSEINSNT